MPPVTFYYPFAEEIEQLPELSLDDWRPWCHPRLSRRRAWIIQTFLRLQAAGYPISISPVLPASGIVVLLPDREMRHSFLRIGSSRLRRLFIVSVRADISGFRQFFADAEIVQNGKFADERTSYFVPHWPQPAIIPRAESRGSRIEVVAYKGRTGSLVKEFRSEAWHRRMDDLGVRFVLDSPSSSDLPNWHDYSDIDLVLAVRTDFGDGKLRCEKPASKLINAWHAGVPALLGKEYAYRELRKSPLDFIEVESATEAADAVARLFENPAEYDAMRERGRTRAAEFTPDRIVERWAEVLFERLPEVARRRRIRFSPAVPFGVRKLINFVTSPPSPYEARKLIGSIARTQSEKVRIPPTSVAEADALTPSAGHINPPLDDQ